MGNLIDIRQINQIQLGNYITGVVSGVVSNILVSGQNVHGASVFAYTGFQIASGVDNQFIGYGYTFSSKPLVEATLINNSGDPILVFGISGKSNSGCYIQLSNITTTSNYFVDLYSAR